MKSVTVSHEPHVLVIETGKGLTVRSLTEKRWKSLSPTFCEARLSVDGVGVWVKYQRWIDATMLNDAVQSWVGDVQGVPF